ncbi:MAG: hypothetical protein ABJZ55_14595 [Fuerstiella sp.]
MIHKIQLQITAVLITLAIALSGVGATEVVHKTFDIDPTISTHKQTVDKKGDPNDHHEQLRGSFGLYAVKNQDFTLRFDIQVNKFQHYCPVKFGFQNSSTGQLLGVGFSRGSMNVLSAFVQEAEKSKPVTQNHRKQHLPSAMTVTLSYSADTRDLAVRVQDQAEKVVVADFTFSDIGPVSLDSFYLETQRFNDVGTVWYDSDEKNIFIRGAVGPKFMAEMSLDNVVLKFDRK